MINDCGALAGMRIGSSATLSTTNTTSLNLGANPGCCGQKLPATRNGQSSVRVMLVYMHLVICSSY
ncbi:hypothetical protein B7P43_G14425 [Cryptotermes secundus]|uniref:Uncharacterized protein n=1 Tax=Cryptotermes secundus TaxID=105785 RepID=A0A2J7RKP1_9NEOP|nr:hypothetical protein B7P43_G14425 [Cryptotermes secundus]